MTTLFASGIQKAVTRGRRNGGATGFLAFKHCRRILGGGARRVPRAQARPGLARGASVFVFDVVARRWRASVESRGDGVIRSRRRASTSRRRADDEGRRLLKERAGKDRLSFRALRVGKGSERVSTAASRRA